MRAVNKFFHLKGKEEEKNNYAVKKKSKWEYHLYKFKTAKFEKDLHIVLKAKKEENEFLNKFYLIYKHDESTYYKFEISQNK